MNAPIDAFATRPRTSPPRPELSGRRGPAGRPFAALGILSLLTACGGGGGAVGLAPTVDPADAPEATAARFLTRATFGPTPEAVDRVVAIGPEAWIDEQADFQQFLPATVWWELWPLDCGYPSYPFGLPPCPPEVLDAQKAALHRLWWEHALFADAALRQRLVFAWSEILVVSLQDGILELYPRIVGGWHDMLLYHCLGNFRDLLEQVARGPAMGTYLSLVKSRKADSAEGNHPDENFAREVMQLFTLGLVELEPDGTPRLDGDGQTIPTYDQTQVQELARVFTGYTYGKFGTPEFGNGTLEEFLAKRPMVGALDLWGAFHDPGEKQLPGGQVAPGGAYSWNDLEAALDALAGHPNVGPFLGRQLIQKLVTSNPSPEYVARVAAVWDDDGNGVRGNLLAVTKAVLLDPEADAAAEGGTTGGKLREPILLATALWRAFGVQPVEGEPVFPGSEVFGQAPYQSPSVFNFFGPDHTTPDLAALGLVGPELQLWDHSVSTRTLNFLTELVREGSDLNPTSGWTLPRLALSELLPLADDSRALVDEIDRRLLGTTLDDGVAERIVTHLDGIPAGPARVTEAVLVVVQSPSFLLQR